MMSAAIRGARDRVAGAARVATEAGALIVRPTGTRPVLTRRGRLFDLAIGIVHAVVVLRYLVQDPTGPQPVRWLPGSDVRMPVPAAPITQVDPLVWAGLVAAVLLASTALVFRRRYPLAVLWVLIGLTLATQRPSLTAYGCVIAGYSAAAYGTFRVPTLASLLGAAVAVSAFADSAVPGVPDGYLPFVVLVPIVVAADAMRAWRNRAEAHRARLAEVERERVDDLRHAVEQERARIARELHDVVTHNVSVMVIQAGAARTIMDTDPGQARQALLAVESGGRSAMTELRQVMGLLTADAPADAALGDVAGIGHPAHDGDPGSTGHPAHDGGPVGTGDPALDGGPGSTGHPAHGGDPGGTGGPAHGAGGPGSVDAVPLAPQPNLDGLAALVARVRDGGLPVTVSVLGAPRPVPSGIELTAYRVVQEALTNMVKHAVGATATVTVQYAADRLRVEITDTGGQAGPAAATGAGRGLVGLRERLAVHRGTLAAGPRRTGGFRVTATIPLPPGAAHDAGAPLDPGTPERQTGSVDPGAARDRQSPADPTDPALSLGPGAVRDRQSPADPTVPVDPGAARDRQSPADPTVPVDPGAVRDRQSPADPA